MYDLIETAEAQPEEKKKRKSLRDMVRIALESKLDAAQIEEFKKRGAGQGLTDDEYNVLFAVIMGQAKSAANGNTSAFKELSDILKADEELQAEHQFELPARILGRAFVDVHRMVLNHEYSEFVFKGGRLSLKSSTIPLFIFELIKQNPTFHALAVRPYENTLRDSVYAQFQWAISELDDSHNWKLTTSPMQCEYLPTGQRIYLRGADDPGKIKSIKPPFGHIAILWFE
ncbi:MAG: hypothetical protein EOL95_12200, partial [Bacteroidia bacterium]|nr:hypothetical protein [Bacteroidia bacterium]